jgi:hypothetical protein
MSFERLASVALKGNERPHTASSAKIREDGALVLEFHDWRADYEPAAAREYADQMIIEAGFKDQLLLRLLAERFADFEAACKWVAGHSIPRSECTDYNA